MNRVRRPAGIVHVTSIVSSFLLAPPFSFIGIKAIYRCLVKQCPNEYLTFILDVEMIPIQVLVLNLPSLLPLS